MSAVTFLVTLEEHFGIEIHDDEVDAKLFSSLGSISDYVAGKLE